MTKQSIINQDTVVKPIGKIITFYSFKGGSGRSMSLANLAVLFSKQSGGKKVLMIDWDLEAPGLFEFFKGKISESELQEKAGVIELFELAKQKLPKDVDEEDLDGRKKAISLIQNHLEKNLIRLQTNEHLEMLQAGKPGPEYAASVQRFDWRGFFESHYAFFSAFIEFLKSRWDYILIDSRTGLTDTGGICTAILPEALVTVFTPTRQGLKVVEMIERALSFRKGAGDMRPLVVYPLVSRVDASEEDRNREWKEIYTPLFQDLFKRLYELPKCDLKRYFGKVEIHYVRKFAYGEQVSVLEPYDLQNRFELPARYNELAQIVIGSYLPWEAPDLPDIPMTDANRVGYYAVELQNNEEYKRAEQYYQKAIEMNPNNATHLGNYATFLYDVKKDMEGAEVYYLKALEAEPNNAIQLGNYASFLQDVKKDYEGAEVYYLKSLKADPNIAIHMGNYASFLYEVKKDYEGAEAYFLKALEAEPNNAIQLGNFASLLQDVKKDYEAAESYYLKSLKANPNSAIHLGNYAIFLKDVKKDYESAETYFLKSLEIDPNSAIHLGNYALFLKDVKKDYESTDVYYLKSLEADSNNATTLGNYAIFLKDIKKDYEGAETYYLKSLEANPSDPNQLCNYAQLLFWTNRKKEAEEKVNQSLALNPDNSDLLSELWFYRYAHAPIWREQALKELQKLLAKGARTPGWNFEPDIELATKGGHPDPAMLRKIADELTSPETVTPAKK